MTKEVLFFKLGATLVVVLAGIGVHYDWLRMRETTFLGRLLTGAIFFGFLCNDDGTIKKSAKYAIYLFYTAIIVMIWAVFPNV